MIIHTHAPLDMSNNDTVMVVVECDKNDSVKAAVKFGCGFIDSFYKTDYYVTELLVGDIGSDTFQVQVVLSIIPLPEHESKIMRKQIDTAILVPRETARYFPHIPEAWSHMRG